VVERGRREEKGSGREGGKGGRKGEEGDCLHSLYGGWTPLVGSQIMLVSLQAENRELRCSTPVVSLAVYK